MTIARATVKPGITALCTTLALTCFAANSILCRSALGPGEIDASSFTLIRLASGAATLWILAQGRRTSGGSGPGRRWTSAMLLFAYAIAFSFAYGSLSAGTGALILFGTVQATMIGAALRIGERPHILEWMGFSTAVAGLLVLVFPGLSAPSPAGALLIAVAGISWGIYSIRGRSAGDPLLDSKSSFILATPFAVVTTLIMISGLRISPRGALLAALSGSLASGIGYVLWFAAMKGLSATRAAVVQLCVPVLAAFGGALVLGEAVSIRLAVSGLLVLGGVAAAIAGRTGAKRAPEAPR